ncbi:MAG: YggS family pyridoxal phosphate-dependent enzyme [Anaerolineae bacterium]|nr:YggS family pyridoxal phosphate-dependent enzyme [Anaerolineae bacterium]
MQNIVSLEANLLQVKARIADAAIRAGRSPEEICLVAVTKTFPPTTILEALQLGQHHFGENRAEEGAAKIPQIVQTQPQPLPVWHMIGHIQRRKAPLVVEHFDYVHSLDRLTLAEKLSELAVAAHRELPVLLECNVAGEASKYGYALQGWETQPEVRGAFWREVTAILALPGLQVRGLMTMAPIAEDPETVRPVFASLRALRDALREAFPTAAWSQLSMGMSDDFVVAVEEGATLVRVGRAIFGPYTQ